MEGVGRRGQEEMYCIGRLFLITFLPGSTDFSSWKFTLLSVPPHSSVQGV